MSNVITDWRKAVMAALDANLQGGSFTVVAGDLDGPSRDRKLACVFAPPVIIDSANVLFSRPVLIVRAWVPMPKTPKRQVPPDPEPVEQLMVDLMACLQPLQSLNIGANGLLANVTKVAPDYPDFGVEATLQAWTGNPAAIPQG